MQTNVNVGQVLTINVNGNDVKVGIATPPMAPQGKPDILYAVGVTEGDSLIARVIIDKDGNQSLAEMDWSADYARKQLSRFKAKGLFKLNAAPSEPAAEQPAAPPQETQVQKALRLKAEKDARAKAKAEGKADATAQPTAQPEPVAPKKKAEKKVAAKKEKPAAAAPKEKKSKPTPLQSLAEAKGKDRHSALRKVWKAGFQLPGRISAPETSIGVALIELLQGKKVKTGLIGAGVVSEPKLVAHCGKDKSDDFKLRTWRPRISDCVKAIEWLYERCQCANGKVVYQFKHEDKTKELTLWAAKS